MRYIARLGASAALLACSSSLLVIAACSVPHDKSVEEDQTPAPEKPAELKEEMQKAQWGDMTGNVEEVVVTGHGKQRRIANVQPQALMASPMGYAPAAPMPAYAEPSGDKHASVTANPVKAVSEEPVSTFSIDVDTASYAFVRNRLDEGELPNPDAVRLEEMINYFRYEYDAPAKGMPFSVTTDAMVTPWNKNTYLMRVGLRGQDILPSDRPAANLVFLLDVSGSMNSPDKLPLLIKSMQMMAGQLQGTDRITIVTYAGASGLALDTVPGSQVQEIRTALGRLSAGGSTAGGAGIELAYAKAREAFIKDGINRVILATDGDFNVGISDTDTLKKIIEKERESGIALTTLGFGSGNFNDELMEQLADVGNGNYAYIDSFAEARKVLGAQLSSTLITIAKDVKIQVEFNPAVVAEYRLIGYENRALRREDFDNDTVDAGEIGAGHQVTALYEIALVGSAGRRLGDLRYQPNNVSEGKKDELAYVKLRYKAPDGDVSKLVDQVVPSSAVLIRRAPDRGLVQASAVAAFGQLLKGGTYMEGFSNKDIKALVSSPAPRTLAQDWAQFLDMLDSADALSSLSKVE